MTELDRMVVRESIGLLAAGASSVLDVNISGASLSEPKLLELISTELERTGVEPGRLVIEVTETAAISDMGQGVEFLKALHNLGCRLALDDFGLGFSSFYYLKHLPLDYLKIDGEFIRELPDTSAMRIPWLGASRRWRASSGCGRSRSSSPTRRNGRDPDRIGVECSRATASASPPRWSHGCPRRADPAAKAAQR